MPNARRGEVWLVDLGMTAKVRPAVIFNTSFLDEERALYAIVPHTTALRGGRFEVAISLPWLENGAFDVQGLRHIPGSVMRAKTRYAESIANGTDSSGNQSLAGNSLNQPPKNF
jgi:mRNA interferase MazF